MGIFKKQNLSDADIARADRRITIDYLRNTSDEDYKKVLKIVDIYRKADFEAQAAELGSTKAAREARKANEDIAEADIKLSFEEMPE